LERRSDDEGDDPHEEEDDEQIEEEVTWPWPGQGQTPTAPLPGGTVKENTSGHYKYRVVAFPLSDAGEGFADLDNPAVCQLHFNHYRISLFLLLDGIMKERAISLPLLETMSMLKTPRRDRCVDHCSMITTLMLPLTIQPRSLRNTGKRRQPISLYVLILFNLY
jgi:hypothetical protein